MTGAEIANLRLSNQALAKPIFERPDQVVALLGAVQAQDYAGAKWALGLRMRRALDSDIQQLFNGGAILRTHVLRPTWHFVTPADIRWMLELTGPRVKVACASYFRKLELDEPVLRRGQAALAQALEGGKHLTRAELRKAVEQAGINVADPLRFTFLILRAELDRLICSGPLRGKQFTYALLEERVPPARALDRDEALRELTHRYFTTRGPATAYDFAWWSGLTVADAKRGIQMLQADLEERVISDQTYWWTPAAAPLARRRSATAYLLPNYDEYFIGYKNRRAIGVRLEQCNVEPRMEVLSAHIAFVGGQIVGGWKRTLGRNDVTVHLTPLVPLSKAEQRAIALAAGQYGAFLGLPVRLAR